MNSIAARLNALWSNVKANLRSPPLSDDRAFEYVLLEALEAPCAACDCNDGWRQMAADRIRMLRDDLTVVTTTEDATRRSLERLSKENERLLRLLGEAPHPHILINRPSVYGVWFQKTRGLRRPPYGSVSPPTEDTPMK